MICSTINKSYPVFKGTAEPKKPVLKKMLPVATTATLGAGMGMIMKRAEMSKVIANARDEILKTLECGRYNSYQITSLIDYYKVEAVKNIKSIALKSSLTGAVVGACLYGLYKVVKPYFSLENAGL